ncbi:cobalt-precorrin-6A reductase [Halochromatium salexigens]|uniref:Cobalt-precorrin-6A reductase n=1 Tax=Halochromatium salexigens TaxID=49447 RepID=A0AAJ0UC99_HALSE|nr:cobalt-precorrin-6A reductase [Halochromatium salexigens]MBK5928991.1 cobalt-precorrin-6A reductase [Halochromatium salexigens]
MAERQTLLILGGTSEGYALAEALSAPTTARWRVISSLAGRTSSPRLAAGETRIGGFGGVAGLIDYLREQRIAAVIDATHPFAATMGWHAAEACQALGVPLLRLERPAWQPEPGAGWHAVDDWEAACATLQQLGARRVLLAVGRQDLQPFVGLPAVHFLIRCVSPPQPLPAFAQAELLLARGPFDLASERALLDAHRIDAIVCKNSGGEATAAKLVAARERGIPVVIRQRPQRPALSSRADVDGALNWLARRLD